MEPAKGKIDGVEGINGKADGVTEIKYRGVKNMPRRRSAAEIGDIWKSGVWLETSTTAEAAAMAYDAAALRRQRSQLAAKETAAMAAKAAELAAEAVELAAKEAAELAAEAAELAAFEAFVEAEVYDVTKMKYRGVRKGSCESMSTVNSPIRHAPLEFDLTCRSGGGVGGAYGGTLVRTAMIIRGHLYNSLATDSTDDSGSENSVGLTRPRMVIRRHPAHSVNTETTADSEMGNSMSRIRPQLLSANQESS